MDFWEIPSPPKLPSVEKGRIKGTIDCTDHLNSYFEFDVDTVFKFNVRFFYSHPDNSQDLIMWTHDVDEGGGKYFSFPNNLFLTAYNQENTARRLFSRDDIEVVMNGLLFHPKAHQHIESPIDRHTIRFGGGIDNPYLYLFNLRYQFCPDSKKREEERNRIIELFSEAIRNNTDIPVGKLLA